ISIERVTAMRDSGRTRLLVDTRRLGNSAYRGTLTAVVKQIGAGEVGNTEEQYTTEFTLRKSLWLPNLPPGSYTLALESKAVKKGQAMDAVLDAPAVSKNYQLRVTATGI